MPSGLIVDLSRHTLWEVILLATPILAVAILVSLVINVVQVLTSLQEATISAVPRLLAVAGAGFLLMPWMWRQVYQFTMQLFSDFSPYVR